MACSRPLSIPRMVYDPFHGGRIKRYFLVPCGKCIACLKSRQMSYSFRAEWEALDPSNVQVLFCTFTYAPEYLPADNELSKLEMQRFIRRLKKNCKGVRVRYLICGEYGELYGRCHYHGILYFDKYIDFDKIVNAWPFGIVDIAPFTPARGGYVAKYSVKQFGDESEHIQEPFLMISNSLGKYFIDMHGEFCKKNLINCWYNLSGSAVVLPRLFIDKLFPPRNATIREKELVSSAYRSSLAYTGDRVAFKQVNRIAYDKRLTLKSALAGYSDPLAFKYDNQMGISFKCFNQTNAVFNKFAYETGRY